MRGLLGNTAGWARRDQRLIVIEVSQAHCVLSGSLVMDDGAIATCLRPPRMFRILVSECGPLAVAKTNDS